MSSAQPIAFAEGTIIGDSTSYKLRLLCPWQVLFRGNTVVATLDLRGLVDTTMDVIVQARTANTDPNTPNSGWISMTGSAQNSDGQSVFTLDVSGGAYDEVGWVQVAIFTKINTSSLKDGNARIWSSIVGAGWVAAAAQFAVDQGVTDLVVPLGNPGSAAGITKLLFATIYTGMAGNVTPTPVYRTFPTGDLTRPDAWIAGSAESVVSSDSRLSYGIAATTTSKMLIQAGLKYTSNSSATGQVSVIVMASE